MHDSVLAYVGEIVSEFDLSTKKTLELGSYNVNGSSRSFFTGNYLATDMRDGPGVDVTINSHDITYEDEFDTIVCTEMLEHDTAPWITTTRAFWAAKNGGYFIVTARGFEEYKFFFMHDHPGDHWRFSLTGMTHLLSHTGWDVIDVRPDPEYPGVFATARKQ